MTVDYEYILRFATGAKSESHLELQIAPSIIVVKTGPGKLLMSNFSVNQYVFPRAAGGKRIFQAV